jgi:general stress protein 26
MSPYARAEDRAVWFITAHGTDLVDAVSEGPAKATLIVTGSGDLHARSEGMVRLATDRAKLEQLWNPVVSSWFDDIDDPDIRPIRLDPAEAEVWATDGALGFMILLAKAKLTGATPDIGDHFALTF